MTLSAPVLSAAPSPSVPLSTVLLQIGGMSCAGCAQGVQQSLAAVPGVRLATVNFAVDQARIVGEADLDTGALITAVTDAGFSAAVVGDPASPSPLVTINQDVQRAQERLWIGAIPAVILMAVMIYCQIMQMPHNQHHQLLTLILAFPVVFVAGWKTHQASWAALRRGSPSMDVLISLGTVPTYGVGLTGIPEVTLFVEVAAMVMAFHLLSRYVEQKARGQASQAIQSLIGMQVPIAHWHPPDIRGGMTIPALIDLPVQSLQVGDYLVVKPGETIPMDGEVEIGVSLVDESLATGESWPVSKEPGSPLIGGTRNQSGLLLMRVTRIGADTFLAQMIRLLQEAQGSRLPIQQLADQVTSYFVPVVVLLASLSFVLWIVAAAALHPWLVQASQTLPWVDPHHPPLIQAALVMVAVLVVACPCALGLATPMAVLVGSGQGAKEGILIRHGEAIQRLQSVTTVVLDKTGTVTAGQPRVTTVIPAEHRAEIMYWAAAAEQGSEHPLAHAILAAWHGDPLPPVEQAITQSGQGLTTRVDGKTVHVGSPTFLASLNLQGNIWQAEVDALQADAQTVVGIAVDGICLGWLAIADPIKPEAAATVISLQQAGLDVVLLTGDHAATARAVANELGIQQIYADVLPGGKVEVIRTLQAQGQRILMVGDGLNDAAALQQADVGMALGTGTDLAIEAADLTLVSGHLSGIMRAWRLSHATFRTIRQNLVWAFGYNLLAIPLAALGIVHPIMAEVAMALSSLSVIWNSLSLRQQTQRNS